MMKKFDGGDAMVVDLALLSDQDFYLILLNCF